MFLCIHWGEIDSFRNRSRAYGYVEKERFSGRLGLRKEDSQGRDAFIRDGCGRNLSPAVMWIESGLIPEVRSSAVADLSVGKKAAL